MTGSYPCSQSCGSTFLFLAPEINLVLFIVSFVGRCSITQIFLLSGLRRPVPLLAPVRSTTPHRHLAFNQRTKLRFFPLPSLF